MVALGDPQGNEASGSGAPASSGPWSGVYRWKTCDLHTLRSAGLPPGCALGPPADPPEGLRSGIPWAPGEQVATKAWTLSMPQSQGLGGGRRRQSRSCSTFPSCGPASQQTPPLSGGTLPAWEAIACLKLIVSSELNPGRMTCHC